MESCDTKTGKNTSIAFFPVFVYTSSAARFYRSSVEERANSVESAGLNYQKDCHNEIKTMQGVYCKHKEGCI